MNGQTGQGPDRSPAPRTDVCIVGAGPAGALVASRLATAGYDVVVLDAGPRFDPVDRLERMERRIRPAHGPESVWDMGGERDAFTSEGEMYYPLNAARVKGIGGTSLHWQGMVYRLHEADFERLSYDGVTADWPIGYDDMRPYYAEAETELGVSGADDNPFAPPREEPYPMPAFKPSYSDSIFAEACAELGITTHSSPSARNSEAYDGRVPCQGYGTCKPVCPSGAKYDATVHVARAEEAGARVIDRAPVQRLEHDKAGETIEAAVYATPDGEEHRQEARQFVLAAGGIEIPRLLLLSSSTQYPDGLANSSGLVGRYFMDHLAARVGGTVDRETRQNHVGFITTESHQFYDDGGAERGPFKLEFLNYAGPSPVGEALTAGPDAPWGDDLLQDIRDSYGNYLEVTGLCAQTPQKSNRIELNPDVTDDHGNPVPEIHWSLDDRTRRTIEAANERQLAIMDELDAEVEWVVGPDNTGPAFHHMGTTRMGTDPAESVVDPACRTHDLENCWVASSSVFVTGGALNPTLTIAALSLRVADRLEGVL
ncbi:GMC family oxidoreductase [Haloarchaeobius sp. DT45]|uniref:GMC family oxidoreductase n=1 Tax=Haloarchaeobius sp. DT45 TaxID=3446116 RepID=UPI003F6C95E9